MTDEELVQLARRGDSDAFDQLVLRHQQAVYRAALAALRVPQEAQEAAQDALVRAWSKLGRFRGESTFRTWVLTIAWNCAISRRRRVVWWLQRTAALDEAHGTRSLASGPEQDAQGAEMKTHVTRAIGRLTPKLRDTLLLAASGEYDYAEIGSMLGIPVGTVKWRVAEARKQVRASLALLGYADAE